MCLAAAPAAAAPGRRTYEGCIADTADQGCVDVPVYVISGFSETISHFARNPTTGELTWEGCLSNDGSNHCVDVPGMPLRGMEDLAVSPDGTSVYVAAGLGLVAHLVRDPAGGRLTWDGCYGDDGSEGCVDVAGPLKVASGVSVTADGTSVYVIAAEGNAVTHFRRELAGPVPGPPPATPDVDRLAPAITSLTVTRRRFRAGAGTTFRYVSPRALLWRSGSSARGRASASAGYRPARHWHAPAAPDRTACASAARSSGPAPIAPASRLPTRPATDPHP